MPRDTPYSGVAAMFRSSLERGEPPQVFEDGGQMRDFVHVADVAARQPARRRAVVAAPRRFAAYNVCSGRRRSRSATSPSWSPAAPASGLAPEVTGGYRLGDVRHVVASPERARGASSASRAEVAPEDGSARRSRTRRCAPERAAHQPV